MGAPETWTMFVFFMLGRDITNQWTGTSQKPTDITGLSLLDDLTDANIGIDSIVDSQVGVEKRVCKGFAMVFRKPVHGGYKPTNTTWGRLPVCLEQFIGII